MIKLADIEKLEIDEVEKAKEVIKLLVDKVDDSNINRIKVLDLLAMYKKLCAMTNTETSLIKFNSKVDRSIQFFTQEYGSLDKVIAAYGFNDLDDLKGELYNVQKDNILVEKEQLKITEKVDVTPEESSLIL